MKVKVKLSLCVTKHHATKMYWGSIGTAPRILNQGIRWGRVVSFTPWSLYPRSLNLPYRYSLNRRLGGPQTQSERGGEKEIPSLLLLGIEPRLSGL